MCYGGLEGSYIDAWQMLSEDGYPGSTTLIYHDEAAIKADEARRGDHEGLIVVHKGARYVLTCPVRFQMSMPSSSAAVSMEEAKRFDKQGARYGWRALFYKGCEPTWWLIEGFPMVSYRSTSGPSDTLNMLYFRHRKGIEELRIDNPGRFDVALSIEPVVHRLRAMCSVAMKRRMASACV